MMKKGKILKPIYNFFPSVFFALLALSCCYRSTLAQYTPPNATDQTSETEVDQIEYHWQLLFLSDKSLACNFSIDHEGSPTDDEIRNLCGQNLFENLKNTPACNTNTFRCTGLLLQNLSTIPTHKTVRVFLSAPTIWASLPGCSETGKHMKCNGLPELVLTSEESLPNQGIIRIFGDLDGKAFACNDSICKLKIAPTSIQGISLNFWGDSSYGDSTEYFQAYIRVIPVDGQADTYFVDVISPQWRGEDPPSCSNIWGVFPDSLDPPAWLDTPIAAQALGSSDSLYFLSAALINNGLVDASSCINNGLNDPITANECGVVLSASEVQHWQNLFDTEIFSVAQTDEVPAQLLKNVFLRESQLWPGIYEDSKEVGLGQLTDNGADTALLWNPTFFDSFCPLVLDASICSYGYVQIGEERQSILRGALLNKLNASCPDCSDKIDLTKANFSIHIFAEALKGNCSQVNQIIMNTTQRNPREVSNYADLWRFTLVNYNAGPGCLGNAIQRTWDANLPIDWDHVMPNIDPACREAVKYVMDISKGNTADIPAFSTPIPTETLQPTLTATSMFPPTATPTLIPTLTSIPMPTEQN
jgi:hypothetical protein